MPAYLHGAGHDRGDAEWQLAFFSHRGAVILYDESVWAMMLAMTRMKKSRRFALPWTQPHLDPPTDPSHSKTRLTMKDFFFRFPHSSIPSFLQNNENNVPLAFFNRNDITIPGPVPRHSPDGIPDFNTSQRARSNQRPKATKNRSNPSQRPRHLLDKMGVCYSLSSPRSSSSRPR